MNEIVTFGMNYTKNDGIKVFVNSSKGKSDIVTVLGYNLDDDLLEFLNSNGVNFIDISDMCKKHEIPLDLSPYTLKVILFYIYCKRYSTSRSLYLCDFTDIFFQKSPFELIVDDKCYVSSENKLIKDCNTNTTWINLCYNSDILGLISQKEILNGGSILGNKENCLDLLHEMVIDCQSIIGRIGNYQNIDQASLNKVVYFDQFRYNILHNFEIFNLAHYGNSSIQYNLDKILINQKEPYIIHQYDVIKSLEFQIYEKYA